MRRVVAAVVALSFVVLVLTEVAVAVSLVQARLTSGSAGQAPVTGGLRLGAPIPPALVPLIEASGRRCPAITPALLASQLRQESGFRANAISPAGAEGIAQFLPGTWSTWGRDENGDGTADPFDPADAIPADARLLCSMVRRAASSDLVGAPVALALAGYNAGWGAVLRYGGIPPYSQTRDYVRSILAASPDFVAVIDPGAAFGAAASSAPRQGPAGAARAPRAG